MTTRSRRTLYTETPGMDSLHGSEDEHFTDRNTPQETSGKTPVHVSTPADNNDNTGGKHNVPTDRTMLMSPDMMTSAAKQYHKTPPREWTTAQLARFMYDKNAGKTAIEVVQHMPLTGGQFADIMDDVDMHDMLEADFDTLSWRLPHLSYHRW